MPHKNLGMCTSRVWKFSLYTVKKVYVKRHHFTSCDFSYNEFFP